MRWWGLLALIPVSAAAQVAYPPANVASLQASITAMQLQAAQSADRVLDASGNDTWTYPEPFSAAPRIAYFPQNADTSGRPIVCNWQTRTATAVTYHCDKAVGTISALLSPLFLVNGAAGATVTVIARGTLVTAP